jgi:hypothetical protein
MEEIKQMLKNMDRKTVEIPLPNKMLNNLNKN